MSLQYQKCVFLRRKVRPDREFWKTVEEICGADSFEVLQN